MSPLTGHEPRSRCAPSRLCGIIPLLTAYHIRRQKWEVGRFGDPRYSDRRFHRPGV